MLVAFGEIVGLVSLIEFFEYLFDQLVTNSLFFNFLNRFFLFRLFLFNKIKSMDETLFEYPEIMKLYCVFTYTLECFVWYCKG